MVTNCASVQNLILKKQTITNLLLRHIHDTRFAIEAMHQRKLRIIGCRHCSLADSGDSVLIWLTVTSIITNAYNFRMFAQNVMPQKIMIKVEMAGKVKYNLAMTRMRLLKFFV